MPAGKRRNTGGRRIPKAPSTLERLSAVEAATVLRQLLAEKPALVSDAERLASAMLDDVSYESVASEVEDAITSVHMDLVMERAGRDSFGGYTSPDEAAWELLDEAIQPFMEDMSRRIQLGEDDQALEICKGILLGLYGVRKDSSGALEYASDYVVEAAGNSVDAWRRGKRGRKRESLRTARQAFLELAPEWKWLGE